MKMWAQRKVGRRQRLLCTLLMVPCGSSPVTHESRHWKEGKKREDIGIKEMDKVVNLGEFNTKGGFWHSSLIEKNLIDYFIPFLPLERSHVKMCAEADLKKKGHPVTEQVLNSIADELLYYPEDLKVFSQSGCKKVSSKVDYIMN